jgi:multidrug efflux pump subunit AcrA (membrane-fusion protein)
MRTRLSRTQAERTSQSEPPTLLESLALESPRAQAQPPNPPSVTHGRWKALLLYSLIGLLLLIILGAVLFQRLDLLGTQSSAPTEPVSRGTFIDTISINGVLQPREQEVVTTTLTGPISTLLVAEGDVVSEEQELFEVEREGPGGTTYESVTAPIAGTVVHLDLVTGKSFAEQSAGRQNASEQGAANSPRLVIADLTRMEVRLDVNEVDISRIAVGQTAELAFDAIEGLTLDATVTHISTLPTTGAAAAGLAPGGTVVTYPVELVLEQDDPRLKPGMSVSARITVDEMDDVLLVNALAIQELDDSTVVYVQESTGGIAAVEVNVVASSTTQAVVEGTLAVGEEVLIAAYETEQKDYGDLFTVRRRFDG